MAELAALGTAIGAAASSVPGWVTTAASIGSAAAGAAGAYAQGQSAKKVGEYNARELERAAAEERANAARAAAERRDRTERVVSRQRAVAASGGAGGVETEGIADIMGDTVERGQYLSDLEIASGENRAAGLESKAGIARWKGDVEAGQGKLKAATGLVDAAGSLAKAGIKRSTTASAAEFDDLIYADDDIDSGWSTRTYRRGGGRYYR